MRIRKHAKISLTDAANSSLQSHVICQLNQSPWDVLSFPLEEDPQTPPSPPPPPPPPSFSYQFDNVGYADNGTSYDSNATPESNVAEVPGDLFKFENDVEEKQEQDEEDVEIHEELGLFDRNNNNHNGDNTIKCYKTDGKKWQCGREAKEGYTLCDHHFAQLSSTKKANKKQEAAMAETTSGPRRPPRAKKPSSSSSNPYEFYYYSGFGPSWGKKRGPGRANPSVTGNNAAAKNVEPVIQSMEELSSDMTQSSSPSQMDINEEIDYVEDEDDEEENGNKRARKPIKARSLKSLM